MAAPARVADLLSAINTACELASAILARRCRMSEKSGQEVRLLAKIVDAGILRAPDKADARE
jgi:hypothetical protein